MSRPAVLFLSATLAAGGLAGPAPAQTVTWSYTSLSRELDGYFLTGMTATTVRTESGGVSPLMPYADYGPRAAPAGPRSGYDSHGVATLVTLTDHASNASATFEVPYVFFPDSDAPDASVTASLRDFTPQVLRLGANEYTVNPGGDHLLVSVSAGVAQTPEPAPAALAGVGLALTLAARLRRRFAGAAPTRA